MKIKEIKEMKKAMRAVRTGETEDQRKKRMKTEKKIKKKQQEDKKKTGTDTKEPKQQGEPELTPEQEKKINDAGQKKYRQFVSPLFKLQKSNTEEAKEKKGNIMYLNIPLSFKKSIQTYFKSMTDLMQQVLPACLEQKDMRVLSTSQDVFERAVCCLLPCLARLVQTRHHYNLGSVILTSSVARVEQLGQVAMELCKFLEHEHKLIVVPVSTKTKATKVLLKKGKLNVMITTPDLYQHYASNIDFVKKEIQHLVLDDADNYENPALVKELVQYLPTKRQTIMMASNLDQDVLKLSVLCFKEGFIKILHAAEEAE